MAEPPADKPVPRELSDAISGYRLERAIGEGGAARVFQAVSLESGERVALKVFHAHLVSRPEFFRRFDREMAISRTLDHPGVVRNLGHVFGADGSVAMVMEYVEGTNLRTWLDRSALPPKEAVQIAMQIAAILAHVHRKGIAHLDLKPENVLLVEGTRVRLMDFGISQATFGRLLQDGLRTQLVSGTVHYMAPEQFAASDRTDHRADLFALGIMLHEMLVGDRPSGGVPSLTGGFPVQFRTETEALISKLLQVDPARRYQTALDVSAKLKRLLTLAEAGEGTWGAPPRQDRGAQAGPATAPAVDRATAPSPDGTPLAAGASPRVPVREAAHREIARAPRGRLEAARDALARWLRDLGPTERGVREVREGWYGLLRALVRLPLDVPALLIVPLFLVFLFGFYHFVMYCFGAR